MGRDNATERERAEEAPDLIAGTLRFHDLRHTHATALVAGGNSIKAVSRRLGHSDVAITLKVYGPLHPDDERCASQTNNLFG